MADSQGTPGPEGAGGRKELSMEIRLLIAFLLMGVVLFVTPYFYKTPPAPAQKPASPKTTEVAEVAKAPEAPVPAAVPAQPTQPATGAGVEQTFTIDTQLYEIRFSNRGGVVQSWMLKKYRDHAGKPLQLVNPTAVPKVGYPFAWVFRHPPTTDPNSALFVMRPDADGLGVSFEFSDGHSVFRKSFHFAQNSYLSQISSEATVNGAPVSQLLAWRGGFGDESAFSPASTQHTLYYDLNAVSTFHQSGTLETRAAKDAKTATVSDRGNYSFAGIQDTFFAAVFLEKQGGSTSLDTFSDTVANTPGGKEEPYVGMAVGNGTGATHFLAYVGPKDLDILGAVDPRLKTLIDWGWFEVLAKPLFYSLRWVDRNVAHNYGWSIVLVTIAINILLLPLRFSSLRSSRKMQALAPQIKAINDRYKSISLRDPRKAEQNQEVMELYKKNGVNPVGGCLPMLPQIPILYAFYTVLRVAIEMRGAHWLWVSDLSQPEQWTIRVLPIALVITQFLVQRMTPTPSADPSQAKMMMFMPLFFGFIFYNYQAGLVLYWLTGNLVGIVQQWAMNRFGPAPPPPVEVVVKASGKKKGK
jgi:YidC/Oxa1 family membrane protein insertase